MQLNPGGTLNHKYSAELVVRASGYPYAVVRATGARALCVWALCLVLDTQAELCAWESTVAA